jgi:hypothetical protein
MEIDGGVKKDTGANLAAGDFINEPVVKSDKRVPRIEAVRRFKRCIKLVYTTLLFSLC